MSLLSRLSLILARGFGEVSSTVRQSLFTIRIKITEQSAVSLAADILKILIL